MEHMAVYEEQGIQQQKRSDGSGREKTVGSDKREFIRHAVRDYKRCLKKKEKITFIFSYMF